MKAIILAAGYATRLYPLTLNKPKALLTIGGKTILDFLIDQLEGIEEVKEIIIVSNHKFIRSFQDWQRLRITSKDLKIIDDGTVSHEQRLGAIGDINLVIMRERIKEDLFILAGDNIFTFSLRDYVKYFKEKNKDCILVQEIDQEEELRRMGVAMVDTQGRVIHFAEKPEKPASKIGVFALYIYRRDTLPLFKEYLAEGNIKDAPGHFLEWLYLKKELYAYFSQGDCFDIGTPESYLKVKKILELRRNFIT